MTTTAQQREIAELKARAPLADDMIEVSPDLRVYVYRGEDGSADVYVSDSTPPRLQITTHTGDGMAPAMVALSARQIAEIMTLAVGGAS
jgi:hypothetical protein